MTAPAPAPVRLEDVVHCLEVCVDTLGRLAAVMNVIQERSRPGSDAAHYADMGWHGACWLEGAAGLFLEQLQKGRVQQMTAPAFTPGPELYDAAAEVFGLIDSGFLTVGVLADDSPARVAACGRAIDALAAALGKAAGLDQAGGPEALIEAAPELYQVARDAEALLTRQKWRPDPSSPEGALLLALRAVLAKVSRRAAS